MSAFSTFAGTAAAFHGRAQGERAVVTVKNAGAGVTLYDVIVLRRALAPVATDQGGGAAGRLEIPVEVQIPMASYPAADGSPGGRVTVGSDTVGVLVRSGDTTLTTKTVSEIIGQVNGMWHLALD